MTHDSYPAVGRFGALEDGGDVLTMLLKMKTASVELLEDVVVGFVRSNPNSVNIVVNPARNRPV
jgi:hypothetical protein